MSSNVPAQEQQEATASAASSSSAPASAAARPATNDDSLLCQWERCSERCPSAEALFDHICEKHVGRKSTNNLNLTCGWANCRTTTVKRDHITSHIRVHVPLKPHKCDFCGKSFKRPQDLKKHVKTHADDSVLLRTPEQHSQGAYRPVPKPGPPGYYDHQAAMHHAPQVPSYGPPHPLQQQQQGGGGYYMQQQPAAYGQGQPQGYYPVHHGGQQPDPGHNRSSGNGATYTNPAHEARRRQNELVNEFLGDVKRRQFDPTNYAEVGQRLLALHGLPITGTVADYMQPQSVPIPEGGHLPHPYVPSYGLPLPNMRTKAEMINIDNILETMQTTLYENANAAAAAGVQQPGAHYTHQALNFRQSHSPPQTATQGVTSAPVAYAPAHVTAPMMPSHSSQSTSSGTAALTPPSSSVSHTSGHSPNSNHGVSPASQQQQGSAATYPILPPVSTGYATHSSTAAPAPTLANNFDPDPRRRFSGGMLQRSANTRAEDAVSPTTSDTDNNKASGQNIDPALSATSPSTTSSASSSSTEKTDDKWLQNLRVIEGLRYVIKQRISHRWYEGGEGLFSEIMRPYTENQVSPTIRPVYPGIYPEFLAEYPDLKVAMR